MIARKKLLWRVNRVRGVPASHRHGLVAHMREYMWPTMGIMAFSRWMGLKLLRQANRPHYVALGTSIGIMVGFFPVLGTHTILLILLTTLFRASFLASFVGSMVANPWTVGPMWAASYHIGRKMLGMTPGGEHTIEHLNHISWWALWDKFYILLDHVILPTIVGGVVIGGPVAIVAYVVISLWLRDRRRKELRLKD